MRILLKLSFKKCDGRTWNVFIQFRIGKNGGSSEHVNENLCS
jgi:hypothetical protein